MFRDTPELTYDDLITGEKFVALCDAVWFHYEHRSFDLGLDSTRVRYYYVDTYRVEELFDQLRPYPEQRAVVVTHNADRGVDASVVANRPANVVAWYSQNVCYHEPRLHPLPIGLENERWFPEQRKKQKILDYRATPTVPGRLLYMNHAVETNPGVRRRPYDLLGKQAWCTSQAGRNGHDYDEYLRGIADHFYVLSPEGNGIDCHRTWEALYMNRVPILIRNHNTVLYEQLPVLLVDDWLEISEALLLERRELFLAAHYDFEKLKFSYWRDLVRGKSSTT